jgi:DNA-binding transcriptional ArsR family regulator
MPNSPPPLPQIDRLIHEPARLTLLTVLSTCESADFTFLQAATGLSKGNLSVQISRLEEGGLIEVDKVIRNKKTLTTIGLTRSGREKILEYWASMDEIRRSQRRTSDRSPIRTKNSLTT